MRALTPALAAFALTVAGMTGCATSEAQRRADALCDAHGGGSVACWYGQQAAAYADGREGPEWPPRGY